MADKAAIPQPRPRGRRPATWSKIGFKLRAVFLPYVLAAVGVPVVCAGLHGLLIGREGELLLDEDLINFVLPVGLSGLSIVLWLRHRIGLLKWPRNQPFFGYVMAWVLIFIPAMVAQQYLETAVGALTRLERISQITENPRTKYYAVDSLTADKAHARHSVRTWSVGRNNQSWEMAVYYAVPLSNSLATADASQPDAWLGLLYQKQISGALGREERLIELNAFIRQSAREFSEDDLHRITYLAVAGNNAERKALERAIRDGSTESPPDAHKPILIAHSGPFESRNGSILPWSLGMFGGGLSVWLLIAVFGKLDTGRCRSWEKGEAQQNKDLLVAGSLFVPRRGFFATPLLLHVNILIAVAMLACGLGLTGISAADLLHWGAVSRSTVQAGELWRLLTSLFVHTGPLHFANNMIILLLLGILVERTFGTGWFAGVYLTTGITSGIASTLWHPNTVGAGASGSIFGVAGFGLALLLVKRKRFSATRPLLLKAAGVFLVINLLMGAVLPGLDLVAHVAGFACGGIIGLIASLDISDRQIPKTET